jgi:hypothetical protein
MKLTTSNTCNAPGAGMGVPFELEQMRCTQTPMRTHIVRGLTLIALSLGALAAHATPQDKPLVEKVRASTGRFRDVNVAINEGWVPATPCVSGPNEGAMGVHFVLPSRIDGVVNASEPEALIYEPMPSGELRLVGVEFIAIAAAVGEGVPNLAGHLLNYVGEPNRYGLPAFYEMHVWAWQNNPKGSFADWNTNVSCDAQPLG